MTDQNKSLFHINQDLLTLFEIIEEQGGAIDEEQEKALAISEHELAQKAESYVHVIRRFEAEAEMAKAYEAQAKEYRQRAERKVEHLKEALKTAVKLFGPIQAGIHKISLRKSESVNILDENELPDQFKVRKVVEAPDKKTIKESIKAGHEVPGAELLVNESTSIR